VIEPRDLESMNTVAVTAVGSSAALTTRRDHERCSRSDGDHGGGEAIESAQGQAPASKASKVKAAKSAKRASKADLCIKLARRPKGATAAELDKATGWARAAWGWLFHNRTGNGFAQRRGLKFKSKVVEGTMRYFVS
jgi:hypothetical protein